jgi:CubicO group peptidase (beta-lactamase class C family)
MNPRTLFQRISFLMLVVPSISGTAQQMDDYPAIRAEMENLISGKMNSDNLVGVSAAIIIDDSIIWKKAFGYADREKGIPMTEKTVVNIASITKTFTALAVMQLQEQGLLDIGQPLGAYLPGFRPMTRGEDLNRLTVKSVITHSSGVQTDILKNSDLRTGKYTDVLGYINETYLLYPPGMVESYSSAGYNILGHLIREVSSLDYPDYIHRNILAPLGMSHSGFFMDSLPGTTRIYAGGQAQEEISFRDIASGGIYASLDDLILYARGLMSAWNGDGNQVIGTSTIREMFTLRTGDVLLESNKKGLGWFMFANDTVFAVTHAGDGISGHSVLILLPERKAAGMILINSAEGESLKAEFSNRFIRHAGLSIPDIIPGNVIQVTRQETEPVILPAGTLAAHTGDYNQGFSFVTVSAAGDHLVLEQNNTEILLKPLSENEFIPWVEHGEGSQVEKSTERYCFLDSCGFHMLFHENGHHETRLGYRLNHFDPTLFLDWLGDYKHFGYQLIVGDTKFKGAGLSLSGDRVLMLNLVTYDGEYAFPLNVISNEYAVTGGMGSGFGFTVRFKEDDLYRIIDFGGITFRSSKAVPF